MPLYEYRCDDCGNVTEKLHAYNKKPEVICEYCKSSNTRRILSVCAFREGPTNSFRRAHDRAKVELDMRRDLKENHGIEGIRMVTNSAQKTFADTYRDIKKSGGSIREAMSAQREENQARTRKKQKEWMRKALPRCRERREARRQKQQKEAVKFKASKGESNGKSKAR